MVPKTDNLIVEIPRSQGLGSLVVDESVSLDFFPAAVLLPFPLAAPAHEGKDSQAVAQVIDGVVLAPDIFETDAVEAHVGHAAHLQVHALGGVLHEKVVRPAGGLDQHLASVQKEQAVTQAVHRTPDVPDAETDLFAVRGNTVFEEGDVHVVELRRTHFTGPPEAGVLHAGGEVENADLAR